MRYTESRLARAAMPLLEDIDKDTVDFSPNYDESKHEPVVLPARFPNLLVNGAGGIAVGMATNMPPHNLGEVIDGCIAFIKDPAISTEQLIEIIPGPDFPTGGTILGRAGVRSAYDRPRLHHHEGQIGDRGDPQGTRGDRVHRDPLSGEQGFAHREDRRAVRDKKIEGISIFATSRTATARSSSN